MKIAANAQHFRSNSQSRQEKLVVRKSEKRIGDSNRALNRHTADHAREAGARIRTASLMLCALSLTLPATSAQQPCTLRETTVACADNKAVFDILNDGRVTFSREQRADTRYHQLFRHPKLVGILAARRKAGVNAGLPVFPVKPYTNP